MNFATPVAITAGTTYVASYHCTAGHYSEDDNYFAVGVDNPPKGSSAGDLTLFTAKISSGGKRFGRYVGNCANGTIDLNTMEFRAHDPNDLLTKISLISYSPDAQCPKWEKFVLEVMDGKEHMMRYLQRWMGYTMTANTASVPPPRAERAAFLAGKYRSESAELPYHAARNASVAAAALSAASCWYTTNCR